VSAATAIICRLSGLPGAGTIPVQANTQAKSNRIGNPNLQAEDGKTLTVGLVWQPPYIRNFSATLDYYDIKVSNYVARLSGGEQGQVTACFTSGVTTAAEYAANPNCANISRQGNGDLFLLSPLINVSELKTKGYDVALNYAYDWERIGKFSFRLDASRMSLYDLDGADYVGQTSTDFGTLPNLKTNLRVVYDRGPAQVSLNWQRIGAVDTRPGDAQDGNDITIPTWSYIDLAARYRFRDAYELSLGVTNLTNKLPPLLLTGVTNTNTDNSTYDSVGRRYVVSFNAKF
jgi:iron complex outermembrane recepter protein